MCVVVYCFFIKFVDILIGVLVLTNELTLKIQLNPWSCSIFYGHIIVVTDCDRCCGWELLWLYAGFLLVLRH